MRSNPASLATSPRRRGAPGAVCIVGGQWRRSVLSVADRAGLRPTPERVRETVFDWLAHLFPSMKALDVLDLFAGTGALGIEAASRGAASLDAVDADPGAAREIEANLRRLGANDRCHACRSDAFVFVAGRLAVYDVIFIDPPYALELQERAIRAALPALKPNGVLYVEWPKSAASKELLAELGLTVVRKGTAGVVVYELLARQSSVPAALAKLPKEKGKKAKIARKAAERALAAAQKEPES